MKTRHLEAVVGITIVTLVIAACSTQDTAIVEPAIGHASFARQENRCSKYAVIPVSLTFEGARSNAVEEGGVLASISSKEEQACIEGLASSGNSGTYWINGTDGQVDGEWRWLHAKKNGLFWVGYSDGKPLGFANWGSNEPSLPAPGFDEDCLRIDLAARWGDALGVWRDYDCDNSDASAGYIIRYQ